VTKGPLVFMMEGKMTEKYKKPSRTWTDKGDFWQHWSSSKKAGIAVRWKCKSCGKESISSWSHPSSEADRHQVECPLYQSAFERDQQTKEREVLQGERWQIARALAVAKRVIELERIAVGVLSDSDLQHWHQLQDTWNARTQQIEEKLTEKDAL